MLQAQGSRHATPTRTGRKLISSLSGRRLIAAAALVVPAAFHTLPASAATIETFAEVDWENSSEVASDPQGPATAGMLSSEAAAGGGLAQATLDIDGLAGLAVSGDSAGGGVVSVLVASATWMDTVTNTFGETRRYDAQLSIPSISLFISDGVAHPSQFSSAYYSVSLIINGDILFSSEAELQSGDSTAGATQAELLETGSDLGGVATITGQRMRVDFAPFDAVIDIGDLLPNASFTAFYRLEVGMQIPGLEISADASLGDPLNLQGTPIGFVSETSAVPLPAGLWLLIPGLAVLRTRVRNAVARGG